MPGGAETFAVNTVAQPVRPVLAIAFAENPAQVGLALTIPRCVDAFTDPIRGAVSDKWKGR